MNSTSQQGLFEICDRLDDLLANAVPAPDADRLMKIQGACAELAGASPLLSEAAGNLSASAQTYLSAKRHEKHPGGADALMQEMRGRQLQTLRDRIRGMLKK